MAAGIGAMIHFMVSYIRVGACTIEAKNMIRQASGAAHQPK
jgi:hypothetical protein